MKVEHEQSSGFFYLCYKRRRPSVTLDKLYCTLAVGAALWQAPRRDTEMDVLQL